MSNNILQNAISDAGGPGVVGPKCGRTYQAALKWYVQGHLPRTEWTEQTNYSQIIADLTKGKYPRELLLSIKPKKRRFRKK